MKTSTRILFAVFIALAVFGNEARNTNSAPNAQKQREGDQAAIYADDHLEFFQRLLYQIISIFFIPGADQKMINLFAKN
jgi:hypothetical protein